MFNIPNSSPPVQILRGIGDREPPARIVCVQPFNVFLCLVTLTRGKSCQLVQLGETVVFLCGKRFWTQQNVFGWLKQTARGEHCVGSCLAEKQNGTDTSSSHLAELGSETDEIQSISQFVLVEMSDFPLSDDFLTAFFVFSWFVLP